MKNKGVLIVLVAMVAAVIGAGAWFAFTSGGIGATDATTAAVPAEAAAEGAAPVIAADEMFLGKADAPVTIVEYFSLGCPHCKNFHETILPQLKTDYIDTGKARIVFRDFPLDGVALAASQLTRCVSPMAYFAMVDTLFMQQSTWHVKDGAQQVATIAKGAGMDQAAFDACLSNTAQRDKIVASRQEGQDVFKVDSTPTFLINGKKLTGVGDYAPFKEAVEAALAGK
jgi:protein-disulfide isomerase